MVNNSQLTTHVHAETCSNDMTLLSSMHHYRPVPLLALRNATGFFGTAGGAFLVSLASTGFAPAALAAADLLSGTTGATSPSGGGPLRSSEGRGC